ncbi:MAG: hypothetical protein AB7O04_09910 [Hyphomonadaceae bacterium]
MRVFFAALALCAAAFLINVMGDLSIAAPAVRSMAISTPIPEPSFTSAEAAADEAAQRPQREARREARRARPHLAAERVKPETARDPKEEAAKARRLSAPKPPEETKPGRSKGEEAALTAKPQGQAAAETIDILRASDPKTA